jgi:hypothetical protein
LKRTRRTGDDVFDMVKDLRVIFGNEWCVVNDQPVGNPKRKVWWV